MARIQKTPRRRQWKRYRVRGGALIMLNRPSLFGLMGSKPVGLGPLIDIRIGGLHGQYIQNQERTVECSELSVAIPTDGVEIPDLPFVIVRDHQVIKLPDNKVIRSRGVRFGSLTRYQAFQIETFIKQYTYEPLSDRRVKSDRRHHQDPRFENPKFKARYERRSGVDRRAA